MTKTVFGSCPLDCPDGCSWLVTVEDGPDGPVATKLRGNPDHPFTAGSLCKKVNPWLAMAAEPNRLLRPHRRRVAKGSGAPFEEAFEAIGWDEALQEIAERFQHIIDTSGPAAIWPFVGTGNVGNIQGSNLGARTRLWNHLGVSDHQVTICSVSGHVGLGYTMGAGTSLDPEDVVDAKTVLIWGANTLVTSQHWWPFVETAKTRGAEVIVVDPIRTRTAARADRHIAPRVGTDGALALGICRALIHAGGTDEAFIASHTTGYEDLAAEAEPWTPEKVGEVCGLEPAVVTELAAGLAADPRVVIKLGQGMQRHASGGQAARTVSCIAALIGAFKHKGAGVVYSTDPMYQFNKSGMGGVELMKGERRRLAMTNLASNLHELDDPPVEALFIYGANPVVSNPDTSRVRSGLTRADLFTVVVDIFPTETTDYADIVLPSAMQHEQWEINHSFSHRYVALNTPAVEPAGECLPHTEIFRRLAAAMALDEPELYLSDQELAAELLNTPDLVEAGVTVDYLVEHGWAAMPRTDPYHPMADRFPTASGRFEFASQRAADDGLGLVAGYFPPAEAGVPASAGSAENYDLVAIGSDWFVNSVFAGTEHNAGRTTEPEVRINPHDGGRDGLTDGDRIELGNDRGVFSAVVAFDPDIQPGLAATYKGWWGMGVNATVADRDSDMGRGAVFHDNKVWIRAIPGQVGPKPAE